ncbi:hypothetical protein [Blastococcus sp. TF02A-26]|uniref:hypothetical protein n=1 Tax=Blastococcus sp. TF02A-26 TaxID=2250577 RepID=UPI001313EC8B|nr:hypothetical protein [Blastococcus sp. TF02A-26]
MIQVDVRGSRFTADWRSLGRAQPLAIGLWIDRRGTVQLTLGRLYLGHYRRPW